MRVAWCAAVSAAAFLMFAGAALADDWTVAKLRGQVEQQKPDGTWMALNRGDVVPDATLIRTQADGHADLQRDEEVVTLGPSTQVKIEDDASTGTTYTTVTEDFGSVEIEADVRNVQYFAVDTRFLAAVVKGTHFTVSSDDAGASVDVARGFVAIESKVSRRNTTVTVGQTASVKAGQDIALSGMGTLPPIFGDGTPIMPVSVSALPAAGYQGADDRSKGSPTVGAGGPGFGGSGPGGGTPSNVDGLRPSMVASTTGFSRALGQTGLNAALLQSTGEAPPEAPPNAWVILIGLLLGTAVGAVALLFRRYVH